MAEFFNHNSLLLILSAAWVIFTGYLLRSDGRGKRMPTLVVVTLALAALYYALSPRDTSGELPTQIEDQIGQGTPVLLEFKSPN